MPRTRSLTWAELKIGLVAVLAIVISAAFIFAVGGAGGFFWQQYHLTTEYDDVRGLKEGAVVRLAGVEVGTVSEVRFEGASVQVILEVNRDMQPRITTASRASIGSLSLLGEPVIDITASTEGDPLPDWGRIPPADNAYEIADVAASATRGLDEATRLLQNIRQGQGTVGRLFTDEALYREILAFVDAAGNVATNINQGGGTLGRLVRDPSAYRALQTSLQNLNGIVSRINAGEGSLGRLVTDDTLARSLTGTTTNLNAITEKMNAGEGTAGRLINDATLYNRLDALSERLNAVATQLSEGEGTAGRLLRDEQLYSNMNQAVGELRGLIGDIRADPRRYLNIRVSIF